MSKLKIDRPQFYTNSLKGEKLSEEFITKEDFDYWFYDYLLVGSVEVTGSINPGGVWGDFPKAKHKALLINIQPIKMDTADDVLKELIRNWPDRYGDLGRLVDRAKKVLGDNK